MTDNTTAGLAAWSRGRDLQAAGKFAAAADEFRQALQRLPAHPGVVLDYARLAEAVGDHAAAEKLWRHLGSLRPDSGYEPFLDVALFRQEKYEDCVPCFRAHLARQPGDVEISRVLALVLRKLKRYPEALDVALPHEGRHADLDETVADCLLQLGDGRALDNRVDALLARYPAHTGIRALCGMHLLKRGELARGFALQPDIRRRYDPPPREGAWATLPTWDGTPFDGTLLVRGEQGLGEEILAASLYRLVTRSGQQAVIECEPRLLPVFRRSFPSLSFVPRWSGELDALAADGCRRVKALDLCVAAPGANPLAGQHQAHWLVPDAARVATLRAAYRARWPGRKIVGISWRSLRNLPNGNKSWPVAALRPLLESAALACLDVQYGDVADDRAALQDLGLDLPWRDTTIDATHDLDGLLAQLAACDALVCVSNSTAHLTGAGGLPGHVLLPGRAPVLWYWGYDGATCPWYPALRLWRNDDDDAAALMARLCRQLETPDP